MSQTQVAQFKSLESERVALYQRTHDLQTEVKETRLVLDTLEKVDKGRKCYRMVGGVLIERTVDEVATALTKHYDQVSKTVEVMTHKLADVENKIKTLQNELNNETS